MTQNRKEFKANTKGQTKYTAKICLISGIQKHYIFMSVHRVSIWAYQNTSKCLTKKCHFFFNLWGSFAFYFLGNNVCFYPLVHIDVSRIVSSVTCCSRTQSLETWLLSLVPLKFFYVYSVFTPVELTSNGSWISWFSPTLAILHHTYTPWTQILVTCKAKALSPSNSPSHVLLFKSGNITVTLWHHHPGLWGRDILLDFRQRHY